MINSLRNIFRNMAHKNLIRKRLFLYFFLSTILTSVVSIYTYVNSNVLASRMNTLFMNGIYLSDLYKNIETVHTSLKNYLATSHSESLNQYNRYSSKLRDKANTLKNGDLSTETGMLFIDLANMIVTYLDESQTSVGAKRGRNVDEYNTHYNEASKLYGYINSYIDKLKLNQFQDNTNDYMVLQSRLNVMQTINIILILSVALFNIMLIILFTYYITEPIIKLSRSANEIAKGNYDVGPVIVNTNDEISLLAKAFGRMTESIRNHVEEIEAKAELENNLKEQEMQNLKMKSLLKEAELQSLQSQINPHFMFNTLNAGVQIAMFEGAERTERFMTKLSGLFRYNLGKLEKVVSLKKEIENIESYIYILKERFADKVQFTKEVDDDSTDIKMPRLILQPIVENAFMHGIGENEDGGVISLRTRKEDNFVIVEIEDNGKGMSKATIESILKEDENDMLAQDTVLHSGIGLNNVISRLRLFFNSNDVIDIRSDPGSGTCVILKLPYLE